MNNLQKKRNSDNSHVAKIKIKLKIKSSNLLLETLAKLIMNK